MRRREKQTKKYISTGRPSPVLHDLVQRDFSNPTLHQDIHQQLRITLEQLEHHRLTSELEVQKRLLIQQQLKNSKQESDDQKVEIEQLRRELSKLTKKYSKAKEKRQCDKCKARDQLSGQLQKERQIYSNDRKILQDEIKNLKRQLQNSQALQERDQLIILVESLKKQLFLSSKKIQQQTRVVQFLNQKLSLFQIQNIQIMEKVELLQSKFSQIQIDSVIHKRGKGCPNCQSRPRNKQQDARSSASLSRQRKNGSIQNVKRTERGEQWEDELVRYEH